MSDKTWTDACSGCLEKILSSRAFSTAPRSSQLLKYLVEQTLKGDQEKLSGYAIGLDVFDRQDSFDPSSDPIVRVQTGRLRARLEKYYQTEGEADPIRVSIPLRSYAPHFQIIGSLEGDARETEPLRADVGRSLVKLPFGAMAAVFAAALFAISVYSAVNGNFRVREQPSSDASAWPEIRVEEFLLDGLKPELVALRNQLHDHLLNDLARYSTLRIVPPEPVSANRAWDRASTPVQFVLTGRIENTVHNISIHVRLHAPDRNDVFWSETYSRPPGKFGLPGHQFAEEVSRKIARAIGAPFGPVSRKVTMQVNGETQGVTTVYSCMLRLYAFLAEQTPARHHTASDCLERVPVGKRDSNWWAADAVVLLDQYRREFTTADVLQSKRAALDAARRSVVLDPDNALSQLALANAAVANNLPVEGEAAIARAIALNPTDDFVLSGASWIYSVLGDWTKGQALAQRAIALNPSYPHFYHAISAIHYYRTNDLGRAARFAAEYFRNDCLLSHAVYAAVLANGDHQRGRQVVRAMIAKFPDYAKGLHRAVTRRNLPDDLLQSLRRDLVPLGAQL